ncbi:MAG: XRE family transcriptional regulator, partial [Fibrobacteraceae bacterium]|nr:XRE family transcriptional regulator [Fibrobacteraceae bacterium]
IEDAREKYGSKGAKDVDKLLADNAALFAGGELSQEQKDEFFQAVMVAYVTCKEEAKKKFGRKDS